MNTRRQRNIILLKREAKVFDEEDKVDRMGVIEVYVVSKRHKNITVCYKERSTKLRYLPRLRARDYVLFRVYLVTPLVYK